MWEILPDLLLGDRGDACDWDRLRGRGITHIVNCSKELPCHFEGEFKYLWLRMEDPDPAFGEKMPTFCDFIFAGRGQGKVMVHCTGGVSRSPAVILAYLCHLDGTLEQAVGRLSRAVQTGIDEDFFHPLARFHGSELSAAEIKALQRKLLGRAEHVFDALLFVDSLRLEAEPMLDPDGRRLIITETQATWSCLPNPAHVRWMMGWGVGFLVFAGVAWPTGIWFLFSSTPVLGLGIAAMIGGWLLLGVFGSVIYRFWRERNTPLIADAHKGTLSFGLAHLCRLAEISEFAAQDDKSADEPSCSLVVNLKGGRTIDLPSWFLTLPLDEAQSVGTSFGCFVERTRSEPQLPDAGQSADWVRAR